MFWFPGAGVGLPPVRLVKVQKLLRQLLAFSRPFACCCASYPELENPGLQVREMGDTSDGHTNRAPNSVFALCPSLVLLNASFAMACIGFDMMRSPVQGEADTLVVGCSLTLHLSASCSPRHSLSCNLALGEGLCRPSCCHAARAKEATVSNEGGNNNLLHF